MKKKKTIRRRNGVAKALMTPLYKMQVVQDKRKKDLVKKINQEIENFLKGFG